MINNDLITDYMKRFYGYGSYKAPFWFVAAEESGGHETEEIKARLNTWQEMGSKALVDCRAYYERVAENMPKSKRKKIAGYFNEEEPREPVIHLHWNRYIRIILHLEGNEDFAQATNNSQQMKTIRSYQLNELATSKSSAAILLLRPLPCPRVEQWPYQKLSKLEFLETKKKYIRYLDESRISELKSKISKFEPKVVVFFSLSKRVVPVWSEIIGSKLQENRQKGFLYASTEKTQFVIAEHSVGVRPKGSDAKSSPGLGNDYFHEIGKWLRKKV